MDPDATLRMIETETDKEEFRWYCQCLDEWLRKGGFAPDWSKRPKASAMFAEWIRKGRKKAA